MNNRKTLVYARLKLATVDTSKIDRPDLKYSNQRINAALNEILCQVDNINLELEIIEKNDRNQETD
jgi:hypothetical protein